jgi:hypothetical protein
MAGFPAPAERIVLTHFTVASDADRTRRFYADVLDGEVLREGEPSIVALGNSWIVINVGGPPTDDKPTVTLEPPRDPVLGASAPKRGPLPASARPATAHWPPRARFAEAVARRHSGTGRWAVSP